jgi:hypothetical protein
MAQDAVYTAEFAQDLPGNDLLHWGRGTISITQSKIVHEGELAPGPDYMVYLVPRFVEHEDDFLPLKDQPDYAPCSAAHRLVQIVNIKLQEGLGDGAKQGSVPEGPK